MPDLAGIMASVFLGLRFDLWWARSYHDHLDCKLAGRSVLHRTGDPLDEHA